MQKMTSVAPRRSLFRLASLPQTAAAALALGAAGGALAQAGNATNGGVLYMQKIQPITFMGVTTLYNCVDCHGDAAANRSSWGTTEAAILARFNGIGGAGGSMTAYVAWSAQQRSDVAAYIAAAAAPPPPPPPPPGVPTPTATPGTVQLGSTQVNTLGVVQAIEIRNTSTTSSVTFAATNTVVNSGGDVTQFRLRPPPSGVQCQPNMTLAPGGVCNFGARHEPTAIGSHTANWIINFVGLSGRFVTLQATSTAGAPAPTPTPVATPDPVMFASTAVGANSATMGILLTNQSASTISFAAQPVATGTGNVGDFAQVAPPAGTTACPGGGGTLAAGVSCSIGVRFSPLAVGSRSATWNVQFGGGVASRVVTLQGTATAAAPAPAPAPAPSSGGASGASVLAGLLAALLAAGRRRRSAG